MPHPRLIYFCEQDHFEIWPDLIKSIMPGYDVRFYPDWGEPSTEPAYAITWAAPHGELAKHQNIKAIFSLGAGIDHLTNDPNLPTDVPIIRMGDESLTEGMREFVAMSVLMHHRLMLPIMQQQREKTWKMQFAKPAAKVRVGIMGYGALGKVCGEVLKPFGYPINTWSNSTKDDEDGVTHFYSKDGLNDFLSETDILISILPNTPETTDILNKESLGLLPEGAAIINVGRGNVLDIDALIHHLDSGHLGGATLDVFKTEPLPADHPLWAREDVIITPHIAAITRPHTSIAYIRDAIKKLEAGEKVPNLVDLSRGY